MDDLLVARARRGDRAALDQLLRDHYGRIWAVARRMTGNDADAADATQEAMIAIARGIGRFDGRSAFSTWAYRVTTNACLDELRRRRRRPIAMERIDRNEIDELPSAEASFTDRAWIDEAMAELTEEFRTALVLRDICGFDYAEIAELTNSPVGTVKSRIARARGQMADRLGNSSADLDRHKDSHD